MASKKPTVDSTVVMEDVVDADEMKRKMKKKKREEYDGLSLDCGSLFPNGILKLIQTMLNITCISLVATHWHCRVHTTNNILNSSDSKLHVTFSMLDYTRLNDLDLCKSSGQLTLAFSVTCLPTTVALFLAFLFSMPEKFGKKEIWLFVDLVHDVIAILFLLISFILACVTIIGGTNAGMTSFLVSMLFVDMVVYTISAVLAVARIIGGSVTRRVQPRRNHTPPSGQRERQRQNEPTTSGRGPGTPRDDVIPIPWPRSKQSQGKDKGQGALRDDVMKTPIHRLPVKQSQGKDKGQRRQRRRSH